MLIYCCLYNQYMHRAGCLQQAAPLVSQHFLDAYTVSLYSSPQRSHTNKDVHVKHKAV